MSSRRNQLAARRKLRTRNRLRAVASGRHRLSVFRSNRQIYAQLIDDSSGNTVASACSLEGGLELARGGDISAAAAVGTKIGERAKQAGINSCYFDRGSYAYHGRVQALAEAARGAGLEF